MATLPVERQRTNRNKKKEDEKTIERYLKDRKGKGWREY